MRKKEKDAGISADEFRRLEHQLQALTDRYVLQVDEIGKAKEKEILQV
jgi:ribosome recycling factor